MASRGDIEAGKAHVLLYIKNNITTGLRAAQKQIQGLGTSILKVGAGFTAIGAAIVGPMMKALDHFVSVGSALADMSARTGMAASSLAELRFAAEQTGAGLGDVETAIKTMQRKGITETFDEVAARIAAIQDPAERTRAAIEAWGKGGSKLLPMVENLQALRQEARDLGLVPTDQAVADADAIGDAFDKVKDILKSIVFEVGAALAPIMLPALETIKNIAAATAKWMKENAGIVRTIFMIGAALLAAGAVIGTIGTAIVAVGAVLGGIATIATTVGAVIGAILTPIGLVVVAVVAIGAAIAAATVAFFKCTEAGRNLAAGLMAAFAPVFAFLKKGFGVIVDALLAGDIGLAAEIAIKMISAVFMAGWNSLLAKIFESLAAFLSKLNSVFGEILPEEINLIAMAEEAAGKAGAGFRDKAGKGWAKAQEEIDAIQKELDELKRERDRARGGGVDVDQGQGAGKKAADPPAVMAAAKTWVAGFNANVAGMWRGEGGSSPTLNALREGNKLSKEALAALKELGVLMKVF